MMKKAKSHFSASTGTTSFMAPSRKPIPPPCLADAVGLIKDVVAVPSPVAFNDLGQSVVFVAFHP
ncbi:hypothetical protein PLUA15_280051 [Pseudomonas lundensis]|uniref:Uncharacterized protein n=1 Tax=Pseudomonas lundensis TaxID=86185 RepID=A0AAX2H8J4_9PSED|nr:hypothetical protein PLUA15_280051 [Pseudomonas lundensis]